MKQLICIFTKSAKSFNSYRNKEQSKKMALE